MESFRQMLNAVYFAAATAGGKDILLKRALPIASLLSHRIGMVRKELSSLSNYHRLSSCLAEWPES